VDNVRVYGVFKYAPSRDYFDQPNLHGFMKTFKATALTLPTYWNRSSQTQPAHPQQGLQWLCTQYGLLAIAERSKPADAWTVHFWWPRTPYELAMQHDLDELKQLDVVGIRSEGDSTKIEAEIKDDAKRQAFRKKNEFAKTTKTDLINKFIPEALALEAKLAGGQ
jgi:hypothetical protein